jgi:hypothetical protein
MHCTNHRFTPLGARTSEKEVGRSYSTSTSVGTVLAAYSKLIRFDRYLARGDFAGLYQVVRMSPLIQSVLEEDATNRICHAVDIACIWYWKEVLCLQRAAATTCLLRKHGTAAQMVLGVQQTPFRAHAWVEISGEVVNDKTYMRELYMVIDVC